MLDHLFDQLLLIHAFVLLTCAVWTTVSYPSPETAQTCKRAISFPASLLVTFRTSEKSSSTFLVPRGRNRCRLAAFQFALTANKRLYFVDSRQQVLKRWVGPPPASPAQMS